MAKRATTITIADIAAACGVSRWTVSAVLFPSAKNHHVGCSKATREKVQATAQRLNYRPNRTSRNLLVRTHGVIGILTTAFFTVPWNSIHAMLAAATRHRQLISFESFTAADQALPLFIRESVVDGLLIYEPMPAAIEAAIERHHIPTVYVNTSQRGKRNAINMDEEGAIGKAVTHLAAQGRRQVALIVTDGAELYERQRIAALTRACARAGLTAPSVLSFRGAGEYKTSPRLREFIEQHPDCDAVIAPHAGQVAMLYHVARQKGLRIPEDLAVICMQNHDLLMTFDPPVTAFELPELRLGDLAVETLHQVIAERTELDEVLLTYQFHARPSTG